MSETANVARSNAYTQARSMVAIRMPATAGPPSCAAIEPSDCSALVAGISSGVTRRGTMASSAGRWMPSMAAVSAATT